MYTIKNNRNIDFGLTGTHCSYSGDYAVRTDSLSNRDEGRRYFTVFGSESKIFMAVASSVRLCVV